MKRILWAVFGWVFLFSTVQAQETKPMADSAYAAGRYKEAIALYEKLLKSGEDPHVYYNLGNSYYKSDSMAHAILNYERAALLDPSDANVRFNLELARSKTIDKIIPESEMFFVGWFRSLVQLMSMDAWAVLAVVAFSLMCILALLYFFSSRVTVKKVGFFGALLMLVLVVCSHIFAWRQQVALTQRTGAIVMSGSVVVKSTPNESGTDLFVLHGGTRVEIIDDSMKEWKEVRLADGKVGWMPVSAMEKI